MQSSNHNLHDSLHTEKKKQALMQQFSRANKQGSVKNASKVSQ